MKLTNDPLLLQKALRLAAEMIAENSQLYDEVNTPEAWMAELMKRATMNNPLAEQLLRTGTYSFA